METIIRAERREKVSKGENHSLRRKGFVPAVLYGGHKPPIHLKIAVSDLEKVLTHHHRPVLTLEIAGDDSGTENVVVKDIQREKVDRLLLHLDLQRIAMDEEVTITVPLVLVGEAAISKAGGVLTHQVTEVEVEGLPSALPENIEVDVSALQIGDSLSIGQIPLPAGVTIKDDPDLVVAAVMEPVKESEVGEMAEEKPENGDALKKPQPGDKETT